MPRRKDQGIDLAEEQELLSRAVQLSLHRPQNDVARTMGVSASTVSRLLTRAEALGILRVEIHPPRIQEYEDLLFNSLARHGVRHAVVMPGLGENNILNLAYGAAREILSTLRRIAKEKAPTDTIRIVVSGGRLEASTMRELYEVMDRQLSVGAALIRQKMEFWPSAIVPGWRLIPDTPRVIVSDMALMARSDTAWGQNMSCQSFGLPDDFGKKSTLEREGILNDFGLSRIREEYKKADIIIVGATRLDDEHYRSMQEPLGITEQIQLLNNDRAQLSYIPVDENGNGVTEISDMVVGLNIDDMREAIRNGKEVIVMGGGADAQAMQPILAHPCFTSIVTDAPTVRIYNQAHNAQRTSGRHRDTRDNGWHL